MDILFFAQIVFFVGGAIFFIILALMIFMVGYYTASIARHIGHISENIDKASGEITEHIEMVIEKLHAMPFFSSFMRKWTQGKKNGRKKVNIK